MSAADEKEGFAAFLLRARAGNYAAKPLVEAIESIPRRDFVPGAWQGWAWSDRMIPIQCGETMEGIDLQAAVIGSLGLERAHRVLEIGTGSGYTACVMARLAGKVVSVERYRTLVEFAMTRLEALAITNVIVRQADALKGLSGEGPFDRIVSWASFESMPREFVDQLSSGGTMIAPIGAPDGVQTMAKLTKIGSRFDREDLGQVRLQPLVPGIAAAL